MIQLKEVFFLIKLFLLQEMVEFIEIFLKNSKVQNELSQIIEENNKKSYATQSKIGQNALIQSKVFEQAMNIMGDAIGDVDIEIEQKDNKMEFLENN